MFGVCTAASFDSRIEEDQTEQRNQYGNRN